jgi:diacylglycerol kinase (ATP)
MWSWVRHFIGACRWSASGVTILFVGERAARMELAAAVAVLAWILFLGRSLAEIGVVIVLLFATFAVEALNTAVEEIVNRVSPERSEFGRRAKDLGSAAVSFMLLATAIYVVMLSVASFLGH